MINAYTPVTAIDSSSCGIQVTVSSTVGFAVGDTVLIIQMKGATVDNINTAAFGSVTDYASSGNYEFNIIASISGTDIGLEFMLSRTYDVAGFVQLVTVPQYGDVIVNAVLTALPWDGTKGGILTFFATGNVTLNADIDVSGTGFRGGDISIDYYDGSCSEMDYYYPHPSDYSAEKGEGIADLGVAFEAGRGRYANGGGGGNLVNAGGAGGGNFAVGGRGGDQWDGGCPAIPIGGDPGIALPWSTTQNKFFLGGGGGIRKKNNLDSTPGEDGGGMVIIQADEITGTGNSILANGINAIDAANDGAGGGGAGGAVILDVNTFTGPLNVNLDGGNGASVWPNHGPGGGGGGGVFWYSGGTYPASVTGTYTGGIPGEVSPGNSFGAAAGSDGGPLDDLIFAFSNVPATSIACDVDFTDETCPGADDGTITLSATSGTSPFNYDITVASNTTGIFTGLPDGSYDVTVTDANGCEFTTTITIDAGTGLTVDIDFTNEACGDAEDGTMTLTPTSGDSPYNFDIGVASNTTGDFSGLDDGTYTITVTDDNGCVFNGSVTITEAAGINLAVVSQNDPSCFGFTDGSVTVETLGGSPAYDYTWSPTNPIPGSTYNNLGDGTVTVYVTDANGCEDSLVIVINEPEALDADLSLFMPVCNGDQNGYAVVDTVYNAQGDLTNITYIWNPDPSSVSGVGADSSYNLPAGTYTLTINDDNGCSNEITFEITQPDELIFTEIGYEPAYCRLFPYQSGNGVVYAAAGGGTPDYTYVWENLSTGATNNATTWGGLNPGCYEITVTDDAGCVLTQILCVDSLNPIADFDVTSAELNGNLEGTAVVCALFTNTSQYFANPSDPLADTTFFWNLDTPNNPWTLTHDFYQTFDTCYTEGGLYEVCLIAQNKNGCVDTTCKTITVFTPLTIEPLNVFTPDGDGVNDEFTFSYFAKGVKEFHCVIVNRWGQKLAEINDISAGWNGTDKSGSKCRDGVYFYTYDGTAQNGETFSGQGTIQILGSGL